MNDYADDTITLVPVPDGWRWRKTSRLTGTTIYSVVYQYVEDAQAARQFNIVRWEW